MSAPVDGTRGGTLVAYGARFRAPYATAPQGRISYSTRVQLDSHRDVDTCILTLTERKD